MKCQEKESRWEQRCFWEAQIRHRTTHCDERKSAERHLVRWGENAADFSIA